MNKMTIGVFIGMVIGIILASSLRDTLLWRKARGAITRLLSPGYSCCQRCGTAWPYCKPHHTRFDEGSTCFPLCERCWSELAPSERLPYYEALMETWDTQHAVNAWPSIRAAVLEGK